MTPKERHRELVDRAKSVRKEIAIARFNLVKELSPDNVIFSKYGQWFSDTKTWYDNNGWMIEQYASLYVGLGKPKKGN